jgi:tripartite-type tricarboxylate transporter receptor subunit TctC
MTKWAAAAALAVLATVASHDANAQGYPNKPVKVLVTSTAGGPLDVFTRLVVAKMEQKLKQPFVVEDKPGAGGNIAITTALQAPADGYTIVFSIDTTFTVNPSLFKNIPFDVDKDMIPISVLAKFGQVLAVQKDLPVSSVKDFVTLAQSKDFSFGSAGIGSPSHLSLSSLQAATSLRATHVPYRGNPPMLLALVGGEIQAAMAISTSLFQLAREGKVKLLAYSDKVRSEVIPEVPTMREQGYPDFELVFAYAMLAPKGTPKEVVDVLHAAATEAVNAPDVRNKLKSVDTIPIALSSADSVEWLRGNRKRWSDVAARTGLKAE